MEITKNCGVCAWEATGRKPAYLLLHLIWTRNLDKPICGGCWFMFDSKSDAGKTHSRVMHRDRGRNEAPVMSINAGEKIDVGGCCEAWSDCREGGYPEVLQISDQVILPLILLVAAGSGCRRRRASSYHHHYSRCCRQKKDLQLWGSPTFMETEGGGATLMFYEVYTRVPSLFMDYWTEVSNEVVRFWLEQV